MRLRRLLELLELCADQRFAGCAADAALPGRRGAGAGLEWESSESNHDVESKLDKSYQMYLDL